MSRRRAQRRARDILAYWLPRGGALIVKRLDRRWLGWHSTIAEEIEREQRHAIDRHRLYWRHHYVLAAMAPGAGYGVRELRDATCLGKKAIRRTLRELVAEGKVERRERDGLYVLVPYSLPFS